MTRRIGVVVAVGAIVGLALLAVWITPAQVGSAINWKVTVRNDTGYKCAVTVWFDNGKDQYESKGTKVLANGASATWETGAFCPWGLTGRIFRTDGTTRKIQDKCTVGTDVDISICSATCWNTSRGIHRTSGSGEPEDDDYHFFKI